MHQALPQVRNRCRCAADALGSHRVILQDSACPKRTRASRVAEQQVAKPWCGALDVECLEPDDSYRYDQRLRRQVDRRTQVIRVHAFRGPGYRYDDLFYSATKAAFLPLSLKPGLEVLLLYTVRGIDYE